MHAYTHALLVYEQDYVKKKHGRILKNEFLENTITLFPFLMSIIEPSSVGIAVLDPGVNNTIC